jgi:hypothetical protein
VPIEIKDAADSQVYDLPGAGEVTVREAERSAAQRISDSLALTRLARLSAAGFVLLTSTYFLLSSFTFSWLNIVQNENVLWIPKVVDSFAWMYWVVLALNGMTLLRAFRHRGSRWIAEAAFVLFTTIGLLLTRVYRLYDLPLSFANLAWSVALTLPLAALGVHDLTMYGGAELWKRRPARQTMPLGWAFAGGAIVAAAYFAVALARYPSLRAHLAPALALLGTAACLQGLLFFCLAILFSLAGRSAKRNGRVPFVLSLGLLWIFSSVLLRRLVTPALSFNNGWADVWAWSYPIGFVVMLAGWEARRAAMRSEAVSVRVEEMLAGVLPEGEAWTAGAAVLALLATFAIPHSIEQVDWNFLFQRLTAVGVWALALAVGWRWFARPAGKRYAWKKNLAMLLIAAGCCFALAQSARVWRRFHLKAVSQAGAQYAGMDASFQVAEIAFRPVIHDRDRTGLFAFLRRNALIVDTIHPPALKLVASFQPAAGPKPDIYIVVVDTMRRDYLSPYNPRVTFTPHIAAFAKESVVFQHAYTNYGGTALSEPAIWAGMMMPSKHYVEPFAEIDALEQLSNGDGYQRVFTADQILRHLLTPARSDVLLNVGKMRYFGLDLRDAVAEIEHLPAAGAPRFVYTQPQNLHPLTLNRLAGLGVKVEDSYPGFHPRYAEELSKVDVAFGELIDSLKAAGKFDSSIVILTSDHGDWLGEYGRWGHGQSLLPPIIEVPLLIHLPAKLAGKMYCNPQQEVFLTDITPSLYYLLGHRGLRRGEFYGRPLFTETAEEQSGYARPYHFFMSSYAAVFAVKEEATQTFYVADAVDDNQSVYQLSEDWFGLDNLIDRASQQKFEALTRGYIERLNALYGYSGGR